MSLLSFCAVKQNTLFKSNGHVTQEGSSRSVCPFVDNKALVHLSIKPFLSIHSTKMGEQLFSSFLGHSAVRSKIAKFDLSL